MYPKTTYSKKCTPKIILEIPIKMTIDAKSPKMAVLEISDKSCRRSNGENLLFVPYYLIYSLFLDLVSLNY